MKGQPATYWAKLTIRDGAVARWHPLLDHSADVCACTVVLLEQDVIRHRLARLGGIEELTGAQCARLGCFAALHDVGKYNTGFQNRAWSHRQPQAGHVKEVLGLFGGGRNGRRLAEALGFEELSSWGSGETAGRCLIAAFSHHG